MMKRIAILLCFALLGAGALVHGATTHRWSAVTPDTSRVERLHALAQWLDATTVATHRKDLARLYSLDRIRSFLALRAAAQARDEHEAVGRAKAGLGIGGRAGGCR